MDYRKMWESLKAEIEMGVEEGRECGYNDPKHENFDKFWTYDRILTKMDMLEELERKI